MTDAGVLIVADRRTRLHMRQDGAIYPTDSMSTEAAGKFNFRLVQNSVVFACCATVLAMG